MKLALMTSKLSVIVPCYNRLDELEELFPTLEVQTLAPSKFEIIVVDDGSSDGTEDFVLDYIAKTELEMSYFRQQNKGPGAARNLGLENAVGDFFIFVDSDVLTPPHWLETIYREVNAQKLDAFGGPDMAHESFSSTLKAIDYAMTSFITTGGLRGRKGKKLAKFFPRSFNMGLSKKIYDKIGGFGGLRHGQDIEYSNRIIQSGAKVGYIHDAHVYHKRRTSIRKFFKQVFNWGVARINLYKLDSNMLEPLHAFPAIATLLFLGILGSATVSLTMLFICKLMLMSMAIVFFLSAIHAGLKYKNFVTPFLVPITMFIQIFAYGIGFIYAFIKRILFGGNEFKGFSKNYYK
jgi:glycosyltransferase involved in cell wall biosynthesis